MARKRTNKNGLRTVSFVVDGKRYYVRGKTLTEAREKARGRQKELEEGRYKRSSDLTLNEYHDRWEAAREGTVKGATIRKQYFQFKAAAAVQIDKNGKTFGALKLDEIDTYHIKLLQKALVDVPDRPGGHKNAKRSPDSINGIIAHINHILHDAVNERAISWNPCTGVKNLKRTERPARETKHRALTPEETKLFFRAAEDSWNYDLYRFLINTGCRVGEAGALTLADIQQDGIHIERTITKNVNGVYVIGETTKTEHGRRVIPMTAGIREALEHQKGLNDALRSGKVIDLHAPLFTTPRGNLLNVANIDRELAKICRRIGIQHFTAHAFRDTFATRALESGMKPKTLQEILGHADFSVTMNTYAHVMESTKADEMQGVIIAI